MRILMLMALGISALTAVVAAPSAHAQTYDPKYPVCLQVYTGRMDFYFECGYTSIAQCNMSASGRAAQCVVNPYYDGGKRRSKKPRRDY
ncbi:DUF3551 domain-containing protein [Bradyrhizobium sp. JYMT SZCCT0428]|uniref:DUF3551 domain-containing protein n=1 Tax=Bradyrhizobium sp. JYMT SZCCT0428 TaxID=2807673 RepID=UPI001BAE156D|nr:DUF3551 domain-containing protein [Bradyrhizobium sp. JYMT SZCCT0428]MBR1151066.1 DUF3551 domain-containing protein [Bradyrhizobium sp. JYMT SZCCT0428]